MTTSDERMTEVSRVADAIWVGSARPAGAMAQTLALAGGTLVVDVRDPGAPPFAEIHDCRLASAWLERVYGHAVAAAVSSLDAGEGDVATDVPLVAGPLAAPLVRMATGLWLLAWWPSRDRLDVPELTERAERWIEVELGVLAWFAEDVLDDPALAEGFLRENVGFVVEQAADSPLRDRPLAALRAIIESVPLPDEDLAPVATAERQLVAAGSLAAGDIEAIVAQWRRAAAARDERFESQFDDRPLRVRSYREPGSHEERVWPSSADGAPDDVPARLDGRSTVEWGRVPARALGADEANIAWSIDTRPGEPKASFAAQVPIGDRPTGDAIFAAVYRNDSPLPEVVFELDGVDGGSPARLAGSTEIDPPRPRDTFDVSVFSQEYLDSFGAARGTAATRRERDAVVRAIRHLTTRSSQRADTPPYRLAVDEPWSLVS